MAYRFLWIGILSVALLASGLLAHQTVTSQSTDGIIVQDADAIYKTETGQFTREHLDAPALPSLFSISGAQKTANLLLNATDILSRPNMTGQWRITMANASKVETIKLNAQILERPANAPSERIIVRGAAHIQTYNFRQPFVEPTPTPQPTSTPPPTSTPLPPTATPTEVATATPVPIDITPSAESETVDETVTTTETSEIAATPTAEPTATSTSIPSAVDQVEKSSCGKAWAYSSEAALKEALLNGAKRAAVNELFGEQITSITKLENFKLTRDDVTAISAGSVRVSGSPEYYNGDDFAQVCVAIVAYVTLEDRAKFAPQEVVSREVCRSGDDKTRNELIRSAEDEAILAAVHSYDRRLAELDDRVVRGLLRSYEFSPNAGFDTRTGAYCTSVRGEILPIEVIGLLNE